MTINDFIQNAVRRFSAVSDTPQLDARLLVERVVGLSLTAQRIHNPALSDDEAQQLAAFAERRTNGEPMAYILGQQPFYTLDLLVSSDTLIPRPDSETLLHAALARLPVNRSCCVADLGTGSGALALALAVERPLAQIIATDRSPAALRIAAQNRRRSRVTNLSLLCADWLQPFADNCLDLILSNPPYIADDDPHLAALRYEPQSALVAADDGFADLFHLIDHAARVLTSGGWLLLEHGATQAAVLRQRATRRGCWQQITTLTDYGGRDRVTLMRKSIGK